MKKIFFVSVLFLSVAFIAANHSYASTNDRTGNINLVFGIKILDQNDWGSDLSEQKLIGFNMDFGVNKWPINIAVGFVYSNDENSINERHMIGRWSGKDEVSTNELRIGVKKIWDASTNMHPFIAGGLAWISAKDKHNLTYWTSYGESGTESRYDTGQGLGPWLSGGVYWTFAKQFNLGIDLTYSQAKVDLGYGDKIEAGGIQFGLIIGYHW